MSDFSSSSPLSVEDRASLKPKKIFEIRTEKGYKENSKNELTTKIENIKKQINHRPLIIFSLV